MERAMAQEYAHPGWSALFFVDTCQGILWCHGWAGN